MAIPMARNDFSVGGKNLVGGQCFQMPRLRKVFTLPNADSLPSTSGWEAPHITWQVLKHHIAPGVSPSSPQLWPQ